MDHISIPVEDVSRTRALYEAALQPLGWHCSGFRENYFVGLKKQGRPALYFHETPISKTLPGAPVHLAFKADSHEQVAEFHRLALAAGGVDHGQPGPRPDYGAHYFAAFVLDHDGHNIEAVAGGVG